MLLNIEAREQVLYNSEYCSFSLSIAINIVVETKHRQLRYQRNKHGSGTCNTNNKTTTCNILSFAIPFKPFTPEFQHSDGQRQTQRIHTTEF